MCASMCTCTVAPTHSKHMAGMYRGVSSHIAYTLLHIQYIDKSFMQKLHREDFGGHDVTFRTL